MSPTGWSPPKVSKHLGGCRAQQWQADPDHTQRHHCCRETGRWGVVSGSRNKLYKGGQYFTFYTQYECNECYGTLLSCVHYLQTRLENLEKSNAAYPLVLSGCGGNQPNTGSEEGSGGSAWLLQRFSAWYVHAPLLTQDICNLIYSTNNDWQLIRICTCFIIFCMIIYSIWLSLEELTPLILETQKQFSFTHICAGASAFGKVSNRQKYLIGYFLMILLGRHRSCQHFPSKIVFFLPPL